jgi:hypothetical protein
MSKEKKNNFNHNNKNENKNKIELKSENIIGNNKQTLDEKKIENNKSGKYYWRKYQN